MGKSQYKQIYDGEWNVAPMRNHWIMCCGCALVHVHDYRVRKGKLEIKVTVNKRATAAARRNFHFTKEDE